MSDLIPQVIGSNWAVPTIADTSNSVVTIQLSIAVGTEDAFTGGDVDVKVSAGGTTLNTLSGPDAASPLTTVATKAITASAVFTFDNPQNANLTSIVVKIGDNSATFDTGGLIA